MPNRDEAPGSEKKQKATPNAKESPSPGAKDKNYLNASKTLKGNKKGKAKKSAETEIVARGTSEDIEHLNPKNSLSAAQSDLESSLASNQSQSDQVAKRSHTNKVIQSRGYHTDEGSDSLDSGLTFCSPPVPTSPHFGTLSPSWLPVPFPSSSRLPLHADLSVSSLSHHSRYLSISASGQHPSWHAGVHHF